MDENKFTIINENGEEIVCEVLFTYEHEETGKNYMAYTDNTVDEEGNTKVYASTYDPNEDAPQLYPIETAEEWELISTILAELSESEN